MSNVNGQQSKPLEAFKKFVFLLAYRRRNIDRVDPKHAVQVLEAILEASAKNGISDEELAQKFGYSQSEIRRILHILYDNGLAKFRRGRHPQHGATRYYWYIDLNQVNRVLLARKKEVLERLKRRLRYEEENEFYYCPSDTRTPPKRYTFDEAFNLGFECPETGEPMELFDNTEYKEILRREIERLEEEIRRDEEALQSS
ncbi:MAG: hypothetical protein F7C34_04250 [Desulfurococcales archaeon]|nr:hypothetical protein [Desulfurococcales archaeon]